MLALCGIQSAIAQSGERTVTQLVQWAAVTSHVKVSPRLSILLDGQFRQVGQVNPQQYQLRTGLDVKLNKSFSIVPLGYVYTWNHLYGKQPARYVNNEHRIWQQVTYKHSLGRVDIEHRLRPEQRFIERRYVNDAGSVVYDGYSDFQFRLRYRLQARVPLNQQTLGPDTYYAIIYDELFGSRGEYVTYDKPDQNRVFLGVGYQVHNDFSFHIGGIYQMLMKRNGEQQENNLGVLLQFNYNIDLAQR